MAADLRDIYDDEMRRHLPPPPGRRRVDDGRVVRIVGPTPHPLDNMVCATRLTALSADDAIRALVTEAEREGRGVQWNVYGHDEPEDLAQRLQQHGFAPQGQESVMACAATDLAAEASARAGLDVQRIVSEGELGPVVAIQEAVWGPGFTDWLLAWWRPALRGEGDPLAIHVAFMDGSAAGAAWAALPPGGSFASLFGGTVLPAFRRRGVHRALVAARARAATEAGIPWLAVDANTQSAPLLGRLGFTPFATRTDFVRQHG